MDNETTNKTDAADEIAAAEAELKAAQDRLDALKASATQENSAASEPAANSEDAPAAGATATDAVASEPAHVTYAAPPAPDAIDVEAQVAGDTAAAAAVAGAAAAGTQNGAYAAPQTGAYATPQPNASTYGNAPTPDATQQANPTGQAYYTAPPYYTTQPYIATRDHVAAGLLAIFLGSLGIHKFYLGYNTAGFIMLGVTLIGSILTFGLAAAVMGVIGIVEGIIYLSKSQTEFEQSYVAVMRDWF